MKIRPKALALISGGLDSLLAARVVMDQQVEVEGVAFIMQFASKDLEAFKANVREAAEDAMIPTRMVDISERFLELIKAPEHGFGANMNPCIDCKILMIKEAQKICEKEGFDFLVTGEVLGERPMSQRKEALNIIKNKSQAGDTLLRPLSAQLLEPTEPENNGLIDRKKLLAIKGRSRKPQLALARKYKITKFFSPAGGCLLTEERFASKLADLKKNESLNKEQVALLKRGRHFRLDERAKIVIGRNRQDNEMLKLFKKDNVSLILENAAGPFSLVVGDLSEESLQKAAGLVVAHSKMKNERNVPVLYWREGDEKRRISADALSREEIEKMRI